MPNWGYFVLATLALIVGYVVYGAIVEKVFGLEPDRPTPAITKADGVDYVKMSTKKIWLIQLLNIAGVGPIFGPILGAMYGPAALLWIVLGSIFAGAVHDYLSGMLSIRYGGCNVPDMVGYNLGNTFKQIMRAFSVILLVLVGVVFVTAPAKLMTTITPQSTMFTIAGIEISLNYWFWLVVIFCYYFLATIMPIDKIIGRLYPIFGAVLMIMAFGITITMFTNGIDFYNSAAWTNQHPAKLPLWPLMFITIACGAISGFHATQSPLMARCVSSERVGRPVFYGSMIAEGFIGLVWATVGMSFYHGAPELAAVIKAGGPGKVVTDASYALMGGVGGILAILGVIVLPITSGDTAFRAARLTIAEFLKYSQVSRISRLSIAVPLFIIGILLSQINFDLIWRYFGWANQTLAAIMLWTGAAYLYRKGRFHWIASVPATILTAATISYICYEPKMGFGMGIDMANIVGVSVAIVSMVCFLLLARRPIEGAPVDA